MISGYLYAAMWLIIAVFLGVMAIREYRVLFVLSAFFLFLAGWTLFGEITATPMFSGTLGWIFRGVAIAALVFSVAAYLWYKKKR